MDNLCLLCSVLSTDFPSQELERRMEVRQKLVERKEKYVGLLYEDTFMDLL